MCEKDREETGIIRSKKQKDFGAENWKVDWGLDAPDLSRFAIASKLEGCELPPFRGNVQFDSLDGMVIGRM